MRLLSILVGAMLFAVPAFAQDAAAAAPAQKPQYAVKQVYPLTTCIVTGDALEADAVTFTAGGRTFKTCCEKCQPKIEKDPEAWVKKLDEAIIAQQLAHYPLQTCVISGKKLGSMGDPVKLVLDGTLVQLCCDGCIKRATANAAGMVQKVRDASYAMQKQSYPLKTCVVSGKELGTDAVDTMFGTTLVRTCCDKCVAKIEQDPAKYFAKLGAAAGHGEAVPAEGKKEGKKEGHEGKKGEMAPGGDCCDDSKSGGCCESKPEAGSAKAPGCCGSTPAKAKAGEKGEKKAN